MSQIGDKIDFTQAQVNKLWSRESEYLYVVNKGETPQEFFIAYSGATVDILNKAIVLLVTISTSILLF